MAANEFNAPVLVALGPQRTIRVVSSAAEAIECLSSIYWPRVAKRHSLEAVHVCMQAWHGYRTAESARQAFIAAAQAATVLIVGNHRPAGSHLAAEARSRRRHSVK
ncbi:DUF982 domain-containing protein [Neomesorhizobium albiziae]